MGKKEKRVVSVSYTDDQGRAVYLDGNLVNEAKGFILIETFKEMITDKGQTVRISFSRTTKKILRTMKEIRINTRGLFNLATEGWDDC